MGKAANLSLCDEQGMSQIVSGQPRWSKSGCAENNQVFLTQELPKATETACHVVLRITVATYVRFYLG